jgi:hypothetical protein
MGFGVVGGKQSSKSNANQRDTFCAPSLQRAGRFIDAGEPRRRAIGVRVAATGVARSIVIDPQGRESGLGKPVCQMTIRSVRTHHFVAERVAKDDSNVARCVREPVIKGE